MAASNSFNLVQDDEPDLSCTITPRLASNLSVFGRSSWDILKKSDNESLQLQRLKTLTPISRSVFNEKTYRIVHSTLDGEWMIIAESDSEESINFEWNRITARPPWLRQTGVIFDVGFYHQRNTFSPLSSSETKPPALIPVFYATHRKRNGPLYSPTEWDDKLRYGLSQVFIPSLHKFGQRKSSSWLCRLGIVKDPERIRITYLSEISPALFVESVNSLSLLNSSEDFLLFLHGFNVPFNEAIISCAQLGFDACFEGSLFCFPWPTCGEGGLGGISAYPTDSETCTNPRILRDFANFVVTLINSLPENGRLHIISHSMGNRIITAALAHSPQLRESASRLGHLIFAAPDVTIQNFTDSIKQFLEHAPADQSLPSLIVYASEEDQALQISQIMKAERMGSLPPQIPDLPDLQIIQVTGLSSSWWPLPTFFLGLFHSYVFETPHVVQDIYCLLTSRTEYRRLQPTDANHLHNWINCTLSLAD